MERIPERRAPELEEWLSASSGPPRALFEKAMEIILAEHDRRNQLDASAPAHLAGGFDLGEVPDAGDDLDAHAGHAAPQQLEPWRGLAGLQHVTPALRRHRGALDDEHRRAHRGERGLELLGVPARHVAVELGAELRRQPARPGEDALGVRSHARQPPRRTS